MADSAKALQEYYQTLYSRLLPKYVGDGKRFKNEQEFRSWVGGMGHGFEESFGAGPAFEKDPELRKLIIVGRSAYGGYRGNNPDEQANVLQNEDPEFAAILKKYGGGDPAEEAAQRDKDAAAQKQADFDNQRQKIMAKVQAFADEMNMPVDQLLQNDEFAKSLRDMTYGRSSDQALAAGAGIGGMSANNADLNAKRALLGYQFQRQQAGQQALGNAYNMLSGMAGESENARRYEQGLNLELQQAAAAAQQQQYAQRQAQMGQALGAVGMGLGYAYGGAAGAQAGGQLGSSLGGLAAGPYKPYQFKYPSVGGRGSGGLGGTKYGNYGNA